MAATEGNEKMRSDPSSVDADIVGRRPNFYIVGAPKAGTTALYTYLISHPNVFMCTPKEPSFWAEDFFRTTDNAGWKPMSLAYYLAMFADAQPHHLAVGEATTTYLYSPTAIPKIHRFTPDAKYIVMLRNPTDLVYAWHSELLYNHKEDEPDFCKAWDLQAERALGRRIPRPCLQEPFLQYERIGRLGEQVERMLSCVPRKLIKFLVFDQFIRRPGQAYKEVLEFLGLPDDGRGEFPRVNQPRQFRLGWMARLWFNPPQQTEPMMRWLRHFYRSRRSATRAVFSFLFRTQAERPPLSPEMRARLTECFRPEIQRLSELIACDLSDWSRGPGATEEGKGNRE
jgi:sulfotransferase family protein